MTGNKASGCPFNWTTVAVHVDFSQEDCQPGSHLEIEGVTDPGGYAPIVIPTAIRRIGTLPIREAKRVSVDRLLSGSEDGQRVEIEGVVQEFVHSSLGPGAIMMSMVTDGNFCRVFVAKGDSLDESQLVDARVRVRGILAPDHNARAQVVNLKLLTTSASDFDVLTRPPADPFLSPTSAARSSGSVFPGLITMASQGHLRHRHSRGARTVFLPSGWRHERAHQLHRHRLETRPARGCRGIRRSL